MLGLEQVGFQIATEGAKVAAEKIIGVVSDAASKEAAVFLVGATVVATTAVVMTQVKSITWGSFSLQTK